ncbi:twin-arginine translocase TatA/TatE family subunit [Brachybacterium endophyticum]|uniref:Sec-independent protein translocase protein TatA n=1 Tax=Brachybacterium endophyticum TaxID=2182385 RepID=A0A2U2RIK3_9MICO|nr:Sec-independent protein translocase subunit TatA [Brachybacterium endophyticum]PWH05688.1 twin-arginine translocase TatA/TatE family subunit [Brachybacterium endophyticum]
MGAIKPWHIIILVLVVLLLFGAGKLPSLARNVGKSMRIFKSEVDELRGDEQEDDEDGEDRRDRSSREGRRRDDSRDTRERETRSSREDERGERSRRDERDYDPRDDRDRDRDVVHTRERGEDDYRRD